VIFVPTNTDAGGAVRAKARLATGDTVVCVVVELLARLGSVTLLVTLAVSVIVPVVVGVTVIVTVELAPLLIVPKLQLIAPPPVQLP
jgi:hypothetical protein